MAEGSGGKQQRPQLWFGLSFALMALLSGFLFLKVPQDNPLVVVPEVLSLLAVTVPLLFWQTIAIKDGMKIATFGSCALWIIGIAASFLIKPTSNLIYVSDALMLVGFVPLLYRIRFSWPWLVFGLFNFGIGVFLQAVNYIPDSFFPQAVLFGKHHLAEYHPPITWWIFGVLSFSFGLVRLGKNLLRLSRRQR